MSRMPFVAVPIIIPDKKPLCLDESEPVVRFQNFGDSALEFLFAVWYVREDFLKLKAKSRNKTRKNRRKTIDQLTDRPLRLLFFI